MAKEGTNLDITPNMARLKETGKAAVAGLGGAVAVSLGAAVLGPQLGAGIGGVLAGAVIGGTYGQMIALNGAMDSGILMLNGKG